MFCSCISLSEIDIPKSVTVIEDYSFLQCRNLESIFLTSNITKIGANTFAGCINIRNSIFLDREKINSKDECEEIIAFLIDNQKLVLDSEQENKIICSNGSSISVEELCNEMMIDNNLLNAMCDLKNEKQNRSLISIINR